eukprot:12868030-Prorocentrum_lima.AAC.1
MSVWDIWQPRPVTFKDTCRCRYQVVVNVSCDRHHKQLSPSQVGKHVFDRDPRDTSSVEEGDQN